MSMRPFIANLLTFQDGLTEGRKLAIEKSAPNGIRFPNALEVRFGKIAPDGTVSDSVKEKECGDAFVRGAVNENLRIGSGIHDSHKSLEIGVLRSLEIDRDMDVSHALR